MMNSNPIKLVVRGLGHVPSKKNHHFPLTNGGVGLDKPIRQWMRKCEDSFISQLLSACQTTDGATSTADSLRSLIASLPPDDDWKIVRQLTVCVTSVPKGEEGADIEITSIL